MTYSLNVEKLTNTCNVILDLLGVSKSYEAFESVKAVVLLSIAPFVTSCTEAQLDKIRQKAKSGTSLPSVRPELLNLVVKHFYYESPLTNEEVLRLKEIGVYS